MCSMSLPLNKDPSQASGEKSLSPLSEENLSVSPDGRRGRDSPPPLPPTPPSPSLSHLFGGSTSLIGSLILVQRLHRLLLQL